MTLKTKILKIWIEKGLITDESLSENKSQLWKTAEKLAKAISEMESEDKEKIHFASEITKIYE